MFCRVMDKYSDPSYPPLETKYADLLQQQNPSLLAAEEEEEKTGEDSELPLIDFGLLTSQNSIDRQLCSQKISNACSEWGFFQAINHGLPPTLFQKVRTEITKIFSLPFEVKSKEVNKVFPYAWATIPGVVLQNPNWAESIFINADSLKSQSPFSTNDGIHDIDFDKFSATMEEYRKEIGKIGCQILDVLASELGLRSTYFRDCYSESRSILKLIRYPPCPKEKKVDGIEPHTDNGLITLIHQEGVGGLQIFKDQKWVSVKPREDALVINMGDLMQAWSNDVYQSAQHKVIVKSEERISVAYFVYPDAETCILSPHESGRHYRGFTHTEFKAQIKQDFELTGNKIGLPHFRIPE